MIRDQANLTGFQNCQRDQDDLGTDGKMKRNAIPVSLTNLCN